ncbi:MAG: hypothetical protein WBG90_09475 [Saonia sp.]
MKKSIITSILAIALLTSCSHRLVGTWTVQKYARTTPGNQGTTLTNIGTMTFNKNNTGDKQLEYTVLGIEQSDLAPFEWSATEKFVTITGDDSEISKTWIYIENKGKFQKWQSTDGENNVQTLELAKQ